MVRKRTAHTPPPLARDLHLQLVVKDPVFIDRLKAITSENDKAQITALAKEFAIEDSWILYYVRLGLLPQYLQHSRAKIEFDDTGVLVRIDPNTSLDDLINEWPNIEYAKWRKYIRQNEKTGYYELYNKTKNKPPEDPELIYAVFRARRNGDSFPNIFRNYQDGTLPLYLDKPTNNFSSSKALENYYNRHKPIG